MKEVGAMNMKEVGFSPQGEQQLTAALLVAGANALATQAMTLGGKAYFRILRKLALEKAEEVGLKKDEMLLSEQVVLVLHGHDAEIEFYEKDIDMMRECVKRYDEEHKS